MYLAQPETAAVRELEHLAREASTTLGDMVRAGRELHTINVTELPVLDIRDPERFKAVGLTGDDITDDDYTACQTVGHAAWFPESGGVLVSNARASNGLTLAAFEGRTRPGQLVAPHPCRRGDRPWKVAGHFRGCIVCAARPDPDATTGRSGRSTSGRSGR